MKCKEEVAIAEPTNQPLADEVTPVKGDDSRSSSPCGWTTIPLHHNYNSVWLSVPFSSQRPLFFFKPHSIWLTISLFLVSFGLFVSNEQKLLVMVCEWLLEVMVVNENLHIYVAQMYFTYIIEPAFHLVVFSVVVPGSSTRGSLVPLHSSLITDGWRRDAVCSSPHLFNRYFPFFKGTTSAGFPPLRHVPPGFVVATYRCRRLAPTRRSLRLFNTSVHVYVGRHKEVSNRCRSYENGCRCTKSTKQLWCKNRKRLKHRIYYELI